MLLGVQRNCGKGFCLPFCMNLLHSLSTSNQVQTLKRAHNSSCNLDLAPGRLSCQGDSELPVNLGIAFHIPNLC